MSEQQNKSVSKWKPSKYNHFYPIENGPVMAYNAFSNSFACVDKEKYSFIIEILQHPNKEEYSTGTAEETYQNLKNNLSKAGFLVPAAIDELEILKAQNRMGRFSNRNLIMTIAPTLACNFKCDYCFEDRKNDTISLEMESHLIRFVEKKLEDMKSFKVSWFGGEPLLKVEIIERLMGQFREICLRKKVELEPASIITNGYLLTKEVAEKLKKANVTVAQVTLDGPPAVHDKRRKTAGGHGTFSTILNNVKEASRIIDIQIRINVDKKNNSHLKAFFDEWRNYGLERIPFYFGKVVSNTNACSDVAGQCFTDKEFSEAIVHQYKNAANSRLAGTIFPALQKTGYCLADNLNGCVVAPSGYVFKCWEEISSGSEKAIGHLSTAAQHPGQIMNKAKYLNWDPFSREKCRECNILPICGGGCSYDAINTGHEPSCSTWKYGLPDLLELKYMNQKNLTK